MAKSFNRLAFKCIRSIFLHIFISYDLLDWILLFISLVHCTDVLHLQACLGQQRDSVTGQYYGKCLFTSKSAASREDQYHFDLTEIRIWDVFSQV